MVGSWWAVVDSSCGPQKSYFKELKALLVMMAILASMETGRTPPIAVGWKIYSRRELLPPRHLVSRYPIDHCGKQDAGLVRFLVSALCALLTFLNFNLFFQVQSSKEWNISQDQRPQDKLIWLSGKWDGLEVVWSLLFKSPDALQM